MLFLFISHNMTPRPLINHRYNGNQGFHEHQITTHDNSLIFHLYIPLRGFKATAFRTFIRIYSLFKSDRLSANIKLTLHKALIS
jgi:hypothetical protein